MEQIQGLWKVNHPNLTKLYEEAKQLKDKFVSFQINHVLRVCSYMLFIITCIFAIGVPYFVLVKCASIF